MAPMAAMVRAGGSGTTDTPGVTLTLSISMVEKMPPGDRLVAVKVKADW